MMKMLILVPLIFDESVARACVAAPRRNPDIRAGMIRKFSSTRIQSGSSYGRARVRWCVEIPHVEPESSIARDFVFLHKIHILLYNFTLK